LTVENLRERQGNERRATKKSRQIAEMRSARHKKLDVQERNMERLISSVDVASAGTECNGLIDLALTRIGPPPFLDSVVVANTPLQGRLGILNPLGAAESTFSHQSRRKRMSTHQRRRPAEDQDACGTVSWLTAEVKADQHLLNDEYNGLLVLVRGTFGPSQRVEMVTAARKFEAQFGGGLKPHIQ
jgi:hypothetical protein